MWGTVRRITKLIFLFADKQQKSIFFKKNKKQIDLQQTTF